MDSKKIVTLMALLICFNLLNGQGQLNYQHVVPPTPEVAAFAKNIDIPMSYSSGTPQINVPLYTVKTNGLQVPLSLSYNASGIRVEEGATWTGLGWNLSTGGSLTRSVRGLPDDAGSYGYMNAASNRTVKYHESLAYNSTERYYIETELFNQGQIDFEPDIFTFQVQGYSGKFYYNQDSAKFLLSPYQNIKIETGGSTVDIFTFILTLPNGVKCVFGGNSNNVEKRLSSTTASWVNGTVYQTNTPDPGPAYITSWAVTSITTPIGASINYYYTLNTVTEFGRGGETYKPQIGEASAEKSASFYKQTFTKPVLQKITGDDEQVLFNSTSINRQDVLDANKSLDTLVIKDINTGTVYKSFVFNYGYFTSPDSISLWGIEAYQGVARKRLYLKSVTALNADGTDSLPPYKFEYNDTELPNRLSSSQDYWGYYNGKDNGQFLLPRIPQRYSGELPQGYYLISTADRRINDNYSQARSLKTITYPTGGTTTYTYESNNTSNMYFNAAAGFEKPDMIDKTLAFGSTTILMPSSAPYPRYYVNYFSITRPATKVKVVPSLPSPCGLYEDASCLFTIKIKSLPDSAVSYTIKTNGTFYLNLPESDYKIEAFLTGSTNDPVPFFNVQLDWGENPDANNFKLGGLRVNKIVSKSASGIIARSFNYNAFNSITSSGIVAGYPVHILNTYDTLGNYLRYEIVSNSAIPLTTDGQTVRYQFITEYADSVQSAYKTQYSFSWDATPNLIFSKQDGVPPLQNDWVNNILLKKNVFEKVGYTYRPLAFEEHFYRNFQRLEYVAGVTGSTFRPYSLATEWYLPDSSNTVTYAYVGGGTQTMQSGTKFGYNAKYLLSNTTNANSKGQLIESKTWYPYDYANVSGYNLDYLKTNGIIDVPVKSETTINNVIQSGSIIQYSTIGQPLNVYAYEGFPPTNPPTHNINTIVESNYVPKVAIAYDANNKIAQVSPTNNSNTSYIWANSISNFTGLPIYSNPVAEVKNANASDIAYTSFEQGYSTGNWTVNGLSLVQGGALTGDYYHNSTSLNISKASLSSSQTYIVTYWSKQSAHYSISGTVSGWPKLLRTVSQGATTWYCHEHKITGITTATLTGSGDIDELRLYPENAFMSTNTPQPLVGITSTCDANNQLMYYEYDKYGRLKLVRDERKNIIKKICYNYTGQVSDCSEVITSGGGSNACTGCTGNDKKCIGNVCETGTPKFLSTTRIPHVGWQCTFCYQFSDGSDTSTYYTYTEMHDTPCQ